MKEAYFIRHCDDEYCDLGSFDYTCPHCNKYLSDYSIWWEEDKLYYGEVIPFECENCKKQLSVYYDNKEHCFFVK